MPDETGQSSKTYLHIENLWKKFGTFVALKDISLDVMEGEFLCFLGPSGCGKTTQTTLLRAIAGLDLQTAGVVRQEGVDVSNLPPAERDFGIVFQSYALFPNLSIERNIAYGLESERRPRAEINARVRQLLELVGLPEQGKKYPAQLSGGQQQRIALARAIATSPGLLLLDEPLSALDAKVRVYLRHEVKELQRKLGVTTVMVTHDQEEALSMADRIVVMNHGVIEQVGTPLEIYRHPETLFVADFIGAMNKIPATAGKPGFLKVGNHVLACQSSRFDAPKELIATIRPEDIAPLESDEGLDKSDSATNVISAKITKMEFLGSFFRATLSSSDLGGIDLIADFSINAVRRLDLASQNTLAVLPATRIKAFAPDQGKIK